MNSSEVLFLSIFGIVAFAFLVIYYLFTRFPDAAMKCLGYILGAAFLYWFFTPIGELSAFFFAYLIVKEMSDSKKTA